MKAESNADAGDLRSVVRTMKAVAASGIGQYEQSVHALADYYRAVELGLGACFRAGEAATPMKPEERTRSHEPLIGAIVFGSDQGLVGQFNEVVADLAVKTLGAMPGKRRVWAVGERAHARLAEAGLPLLALLPLPGDVEAIAPQSGIDEELFAVVAGFEALSS